MWDVTASVHEPLLACRVARVDNIDELGGIGPLKLILQPVKVWAPGVRVAGAKCDRLAAAGHLKGHQGVEVVGLEEDCAVAGVQQCEHQAGQPLVGSCCHNDAVLHTRFSPYLWLNC
jgi:hypothetical protein